MFGAGRDLRPACRGVRKGRREKGEGRQHSVGWYPINLWEFREPHWCDTSYQVTSLGEGGDWCLDHTYVDGTGSAVPIPVVKAQSIIVVPCRLYGTWGLRSPQVP